MRRILFVLPGFTVGGTVYSTLNMLSLLAKEGMAISVFALTHQGPVKSAYTQFEVVDEMFLISMVCGATKKEKGIRRFISIFVKLVIRFFNVLRIDLKQSIYSLTARRLDRPDKYDYVVSCQEGVSTQFVSTFKKTKKIAWVRCEYSSYKNMVNQKLFQKEYDVIYPSFDRIVCVSNTTKDDFIHYFGHLKERVLAIHNIQDIRSIVDKSNESVDDGFSHDYFNIVSIGRIAPQKRFHRIPEIAEGLRDQGLAFKWYIIGDGNVDGESDKLRENIKKYHCEESVICLGYKRNPYPYIKMANLLVNTSYTEACPRVIAEARILQTPVVCADFNSAKEFVDEGINGFIRPIEQIPLLISNLIRNKDVYIKITETLVSQSLSQENAMILSQLEELFK